MIPQSNPAVAAVPSMFATGLRASKAFKSLIAAAVIMGATAPVFAQEAAKKDDAKKVDITKDKVLYVVGYAHLDTQWRWSYPMVLREFIPDTLRNNFKLFEKYPDYIFNFSGSRRYEMMKEYYPEDYETMKKYIALGKWFPCGSSVDEADGNVPSAEALVRQTLYGNEYFRREFGVASDEFMLPDCFGFPAALPTILAHGGIKGFSTQKLSWGSAIGIPFSVGTWEGVDGSTVIAALNPGAYAAPIRNDLSASDSWLARINKTGKQSGAYVDYHYYGVGDRGGAPEESAVEWLEKSINGKGPVKVVSSKADEMFNTITPAQAAKLPRYKGELLLTEHSAGSITSQAYMKRWNRKTELLADAAERASVAATWLGGTPYPTKRLWDAWMLLLGSQMHDMLPGTSLPKAYEYCWNDYVLAGNQFAAMTQDAVGVVTGAMDTRATGVPLVVYNPLSIERTDVLEATVTFKEAAPKSVQVVGPDGKTVPAQVLSTEGNTAKLLVLATAPSNGFVVYDVQTAAAAPAAGALKVTETGLESERYRVTINADGDISSIIDKADKNREALKAPARFSLQYENPRNFPAWNMDWADRQKGPRAFVTGKPTVKIIENGPVRVALEVTREHEGSKYIQVIRLAAGAAGDRVEVANTIDWQGKESSLKADFPLIASNPVANYDVQVGVLQRPNNDPKKYEVPLHQWMDLGDSNGQFGTAILNDSKFGSDKPANNELRLTLLYTPGTQGGYSDNGTQDVGRHEITYAIVPHAGDWQAAKIPWNAARLNQPLQSFTVPAHEGALGRTFSLVQSSSDQVSIIAVKKAEGSDNLIVRLRELQGKPAQAVKLTFASGIESAKEVDGQERDLGAAKVTQGGLVTDVKGFGLRAFSVKLSPPKAASAAVKSTPIDLPYDVDAVSNNAKRDDGDLDGNGHTLPAEQLDASFVAGGVTFRVGPKEDGAKNAVIAAGQQLALPEGVTRVYVLAAAINGDAPVTFGIGDAKVAATVQNWGGYIGQWDNRLFEGEIPELTYDIKNPMIGLVPGYVKPAEVAWFASHRHNPSGDGYYEYSYLFKYGFDVPAGAKTLTLPTENRVRVFAVTAVAQPHDAAVAAAPLFDTLNDRTSTDGPAFSPVAGTFTDSTAITLTHPLYWRKGSMRYTTDGSTPTANSPVYGGPIMLSEKQTITAQEFDGDKPVGKAASATFDVNDKTAPKVTAAEGVASDSTVRVVFSEPIAKTSAENVASYKLEPALKIASAEAAADGMSVTLKLEQPLKDGAKLRVTATGVKDASPAANAVGDGAVAVDLAKPLYVLAKPGDKSAVIKVPNLPLKAKDRWTLNFFCKMEKMPDNRTVIAGFGNCEDGNTGTGRHISKFANGIHFWSVNRDGETSTQFDLNDWQMITATYDGATLKTFKNGVEIGNDTVQFEDDSNSVVQLMPKDPWDHRRVFEGELRDFSIWNRELSAETLKAMWEKNK